MYRVFNRENPGSWQYQGAKIVRALAKPNFLVETLLNTPLFQQIPVPIANFDTRLRLRAHTDAWARELHGAGEDLIGQSIEELLPLLGPILKESLLECLKTQKLATRDAHCYQQADGSFNWVQWKVSPWRHPEGATGGVLLVLEFLNEQKRREALLEKSQQVARIGGWEVDLINNHLYWSAMTRVIHEVDPDYKPSLEQGINFYKAGKDREEVSYLISRALSDGTPWDTELRIITAKGREIWVRAKGEAEFVNGQAVRLFGTFQDIDAKKVAELKSKTATERLALATNGAQVGIWDYDLASGDLIWDDNMFRLYGITKDAFPGIYEAWKATVHPEDQEPTEKETQRALDGKKDFDTRFRIILPSGETRYIRAKAIVQKNKAGVPIKMTGTNWDITESMVAQEKYRKVSERLNVATGASRIGIWEYNFDTREVYWDDNTYAIYELHREAGIDLASYWMSVLHPQDLEQTRVTISKAIKKSPDVNLEIRLELPGNKKKYVKVTGHFIRDDKGWATKIIGTILDITELKTARLELLRNEESFSGAFDNSSIGMALVDPKGHWLRVNKSICKSLGYSKEELLQCTFQDITHPDDLGKDLKLLQEVVRGKRNSYQIEKRYFRKDGQLVYAILTVTAVYDISQKLSHFISQILDITPWRTAENRLKQLVEVTLGQNESLLNFAHIVSHNLRSHATNMTMLTNFLQVETDVAERHHIVEMLGKASDGLNETVQHLNDVVQVKTSAGEKLVSVDLKEATIKVKNNLLAMIRECQADCQINIPRDHRTTVVPAYLDSVLLNLFTNAIKYRDVGRPLKLRISSRREAGYIRLEFKDNGQGIDLERYGDKLFGMYKTFHQHKDAKGIGLFITKNQIEAMEGKIAVESQPGKGTTFIVFLKEA